jgi:toxin CcdB
MTTLTPEVVIDGKTFILMTPQLAGVALSALGEPVGNLKRYRTEVLAALDLLISGF